MTRYVAVVKGDMGSVDFFRQGGVEFLRDAWLAGEFGRLCSCEAVRLVAATEQWPDFEARSAVGIERLECAEADVPDRRRGDEYRVAERRRAAGELIVQDDPVEGWIARAAAAPDALAAVISKKLEKRYPPGASLLVYLNVHEYGIRQAEIEAAMGPAVAPALQHFRHTWVLWKERLYGPWATPA